MDIDDPETTARRLQVVSSKPLLKNIYKEWRWDVTGHFSPVARLLELGSGAGFLKEFMRQLITSELLRTPG